MARVIVKPGHVQPIWAGHPWVYAQAIERVTGGAEPGGEVVVEDARGNGLGRGLYSPGSAIPVRLYTQDPDRRIDAALFSERVRAAVARRRRLGLPAEGTTAYRLVNAEGDDLPGLIVDQYGSVTVVQFGTIGTKRRESTIVQALLETLSPRAVLDRTSESVARVEGFEAARGVLAGDRGIDALEFEERGLRFRIPLDVGQKTGFYLDQRPLRARVEELAHGLSVLDAFTFVGAVALSAARGGASRVLAVDTSAVALAVAAECAATNGLTGRVSYEHGRAQDALQAAGRQGGFDLVVCDPPKLAPTRASRKTAGPTMRRLAAAACRATKPGGRVLISSCSAALGLSELMRALALGARDVRQRAVVLERMFQGPDHPVSAAFGEGLYLTSLLAEVTPY